jgi:hypothetical protein
VVETIGLVDIRHLFAALAEGRNLHVRLKPELLAHRDGDVRQSRLVVLRAVRRGGLGLQGHQR